MKQSELTDWSNVDKLESLCLYEYFYYHKFARVRHFRYLLMVLISFITLGSMSTICGYYYVLMNSKVNGAYLIGVIVAYLLLFTVLWRMNKDEKVLSRSVGTGNVRVKDCIISSIKGVYKRTSLVTIATIDGVEVDEIYEVITKEPLQVGDCLRLYKIYKYNTYEVVSENYLKKINKVEKVRIAGDVNE